MLQRFSTLLTIVLRDLRGSRAMRSLWVFCACLVLGIALISVCGNLLQLVVRGLDEQQRYLFGGDLQISQRSAISQPQRDWLTKNADVSLLLELRTMLGSEDGEFTVVELQSVDKAYPLYGEVTLSPAISLAEAVAQSESGIWGAAFDPILAEQLGLAVGQTVYIGDLEMELRAAIVQQPDRSLRADVRGPPVIVDEDALRASGLLQPTSLIDYEYRIRTSEDPTAWRERLRTRFPDASWEVGTIDERSDMVTARLAQVASVLLLIGFATLFIGGLGVFNSIGAWLQTKYATVATLQAIGFRDNQVAAVFAGQVILLGLMASAVGAIIGAVVAWLAALALNAQLPVDTGVAQLMRPTLLATVFGTLTALLFALPLLGRALSMPVGQLIRGAAIQNTSMPWRYRVAILIVGCILLALLLVLIPEPLVALIFCLVLVVVLAVLELLVRALQHLSQRVAAWRSFDGFVALRLAVAGLSRSGSSLRPMLLSLGTALTLLVAAALVLQATVNTLSNTVPARAPSLVLYDLQKEQVDSFRELAASQAGFRDIATTPLVLGRLVKVNGEALRDSSVAQRALEANDEHKLSYRNPNIDSTTVERGEWWPNDYSGPALVAMEDREADQLGLVVGDKLVFSILGNAVPATLSAIYSQARFETSFWLEAVFSPDVLEPFISRHIGSIRYDEGTDIAAMSALADEYSNVVLVRTAKVLQAARSLLSSVSLAILAIAVVSLSASALVMASVVAVSKQRQIYEASVMYALGTRQSLIFRSVVFEYLLMALVTTVFATVAGTAIATLVLQLWLKLPFDNGWLFGFLIAAVCSAVCLMAGALWLVRSLSVSPAMLLKRSAA